MIRIEQFPVQQIADRATRDAIAALLRNDQALAAGKYATKEDLEALKRVVQTPAVATTVVKKIITPTPAAPSGIDELPVVSGTADEIWTLEQAPPNTAGLPASLMIINQSPGLTSPVDAVNGSGGDPLNYAQINIVGSYVYPAADMNLGFGGFLNFITRNLAGQNIQGAFVNGGLIGTTDGAERGDLDLGIYGPNTAGGDNIPRIIALRAESDGRLALTVDADGTWDLGDSVGRWKRGYFSDVVECAGIDLNFTNPAYVARLPNPSSVIAAGPFATLAGYMRFKWNTTSVYVPCYTT